MFNFRASLPRKSTLMPSAETFVEQVHVDERGFATFERVSDFTELPALEDYSLDRLIRAGVPLQETRTNILRPDDDGLIEKLDEKDIFEKVEDKPNEQQ